MLLNCVFVGLGGAAGSICRYLLGLLPLKTGQRLSGYYPVHQYRRCLCAGPDRGASGEVCQAEPAAASVPSGGGVRRLHHLLYLFRGDGRSAAKRKDRPCDAVYGAEPAVGRDGGAAGAAVGAVKRQRRDIYKWLLTSCQEPFFCYYGMPVSFRLSSGKGLHTAVDELPGEAGYFLRGFPGAVLKPAQGQHQISGTMKAQK